MMTLRCYIILLLLVFLLGCRSSSLQKSLPLPDHSDATTITLTGYIPSNIHQHPLIVGTFISEGYQEYLDLFKDGKRVKQIIVVYPMHMKRPKDKTRLIEIKGKLHTIKLGKPSDILYKGSYDSDAIEVYDWTYKE